jgi:DNA-binding NarL/FixJ family response regulator|tara:strand:+ start:459 stop:1046 length:588 start_codon:yes stop_codon:yes gene_type:complete
VRQGLRHTLSELGDEVRITEAASYTDVISALEGGRKFDLLLLDLDMPGMTQTEGMAQIRGTFPALPLVVVSGTDDPVTIRQLISAGAAGFIPKSVSPTIMLRALQLVLSGGIYVPPSALDMPEKEGEPNLTDRQTQVLRLLAEGAPNKTIANQLGLALPTVKIHVAAVLRQLSARNRTEAVQTAIRLGVIEAAPK